MKITPIMVLIFVFGFIHIAHAQTTQDCSYFNQKIQNAQISRLEYSDGTCSMSIYPLDSYKMKYRSYSIHTDGMFMVFNSLGNGPDETSAGARVFYFFPRPVPMMNYQFNPGDTTIQFPMPDGKTIGFDPQTAAPVQVAAGTISVAPKIYDGNNGGVEFPKYDGLMLDVGWRLGGSPIEVMTNSSTFRDKNGKTCVRKNKELFKKLADDIVFRMNDVELKTYLLANCPSLEIGY